MFRERKRYYEKPTVGFELIPRDGSGGVMCAEPQELVAAYGKAVRHNTVAEFKARVAAAEEAIRKNEANRIETKETVDPERIGVPLWPVRIEEIPNGIPLPDEKPSWVDFPAWIRKG